MRLRKLKPAAGGFTLVELLITIVLIGTVSVTMLALFVSLVNSAVIAKRQAVALSLATNQMEYLKSLPYNNLAVGSPQATTKKINGVTYKIASNISYVDDAYDGCASYPTAAIKQRYCRNLPSPSGAPATDTNPADYKDADVSVTDQGNNRLAQLNTQISARVAETASTTGALIVTIVDSNGNPLVDATVTISNSTVTPQINQSYTTDQNGIIIAYSLPPDTGKDFMITAAKDGYSSLGSIAVSGTLQPTYPNLSILSQQSSTITMQLRQQGPNSLVVEATDPTGAPLPNLRPYIKGGYKKYTTTADTSYYYDNTVPADTRPTTDSSGQAAVSNLVPGAYIFCGDTGATNCKIGATQYYLAAAVPYGGNSAFNPITVPTVNAASPPVTTFTYNGANYYQKVRLIFSTSAAFPRVTSLSPYAVSLGNGANNFAFTVTGTNLACNANASNCATSVKFTQNSNVFTASCTGNSSGVQLNCTVNMSGATVGSTQLVLGTSGGTLTIPTSPTLGGLSVTQ